MNTNPTELDADLNDLLTRWVAADQEATKWTAIEKQLRQSIFNRCFPEPADGTGNLFRLPFDKTLVGDYRINYTVDRGLLDVIMKDATSNVKPLVEQIIAFEPRVKPGELKKLTDDDRLLVAPLLTARPGLPGLEFKTTSKMRRK